MAPDIKSTTDDLSGGASHPLVDSSSGQRCPSASSANQANGNSNSLIPTMYVDGWAARVHDDVNLAVLAIMALMAAWSMWKEDKWMQYALTQFAAGYMVLDACWILCNPSGVKSPKTVLGHHVATLLVLIDPLLQPQHALYTAWALLVEFNTLLLILRRRVAWGRYVEVPFALSWVALRLIWYPFLGFYMAMCAFPEELTPIYPEWLVQWRASVEGERSVAMFFGSYLAWLGICLFQGWWSCALVRSYSRPVSRDKKYL